MPLTPSPRAYTASTTLQPSAAGQSGIPEVGSGHKSTRRSPSPPLFTLFAEAASSRTGRDRRIRREEATQTITEECERLFCGALRGIFLGEGEVSGQEPLVMGASNSTGEMWQTPEGQEGSHGLVEAYIEVWDYASDISFRGFVTAGAKERALFVFFEQDAVEKDLKSGLVSLMELAATPRFHCTQLVACLDRSIGTEELKKLVRNFGWVGFGLATLDAWADGRHKRGIISDKWLFLSVEV